MRAHNNKREREREREQGFDFCASSSIYSAAAIRFRWWLGNSREGGLIQATAMAVAIPILVLCVCLCVGRDSQNRDVAPVMLLVLVRFLSFCARVWS